MADGGLVAAQQGRRMAPEPESRQSAGLLGRRPDSRRIQHNRRQRALFDLVADDFSKPLPGDVVDRTARIVAMAGVRAGDAILDVGTGTGALLPHLLSFRPSRLVACDLSKEMLKRAARHFGSSVQFIQSDVVDLPRNLGPFDIVFCNAVFGNFYDQELALSAMRNLLRIHGRLIISHPMGRGFVLELKRVQPKMVRYELPKRDELAAMGAKRHYRLSCFVDEPELYVGILEAV